MKINSGHTTIKFGGQEFEATECSMKFENDIEKVYVGKVMWVSGMAIPLEPENPDNYRHYIINQSHVLEFTILEPPDIKNIRPVQITISIENGHYIFVGALIEFEERCEANTPYVISRNVIPKTITYYHLRFVGHYEKFIPK